MLGQEDRELLPSSHRKTYLRSVSWSDRSPSNPNPRQQSNSKGRPCLPPLQPLSISRRKVEEWPRAGSDDLGEWPHPPTPGAKRVSVKPLESPKKEFLLKKDKLAFFDKECSRIADHIYLGSDAVAKNREILRQNGITHVLNCVGFVCPEYFKSDLVYKTLWLQDTPSEDITSILYDVFDYFEDVREQGGRVLVHCCQGVSRSTSLVIAYLMWRDGQSFEDAFQFVKAARGVTNPNMGFACQLLQCQKRVHAVPVSPSSVLRMYRMAPHSPYDPLHLVPKMLNIPGPLGLDSRGAFLVHVPSAIYVWIGKNCNQVMSNNARAAASQVVHYEGVQGPIVNVEEGDEPLEFWDALANGPLFVDDLGKLREEVSSVGGWCVGKDQVAAVISLGVGKKKVNEYDLDFEIFQKALCGGVVPPFPLSGTGPETCLPAREHGWGRLRLKFASGVVKELVTSSKLSCDNAQSKIMDTCKEMEMEHFVPSPDPLLSPSPPFGSPVSFSCYSNTGSKSSSKSPSPSPFPSPSDSSSLFTFSPGSSNWSDLSFLSSQPSPSSLECTEPIAAKQSSQTEKTCFPCTRISPSLANPFVATQSLRTEKACVPCKGASPSLAERRGSNPPSLMLFPTGDASSRISRNLVRSQSFSLPDLEKDVMMDDRWNQFECEDFDELSRREPMSYPDLHFTAGNEIQVEIVDEKEFDKVHLPSNDSVNGLVELINPILFHWPTMEKVEMYRARVLDTRSVFLLLSPDVNPRQNKPKMLYVWIGRDVPFENRLNKFISNDCTNGGSHSYWENVGSKFLSQMGLPLDIPIQIVREGEEPKQLLDHLNQFSQKATSSTEKAKEDWRPPKHLAS